MIIGNGTVFTFNDKEEVIEGGAVVIDGKVIVDVGPTDAMREKYPSKEFVDAGGKLIWPGLINAHGHFYGMYSRGMALKDDPPANFTEILERLWWRLDKALDEESTYYSAMVCLLSAVRAGCTTIVDHHASPSFIKGSLDVIQKAAEEIGVRTCLCYEVTDRNSLKEAEEGIEENIRFMKKIQEQRRSGVDSGLTAATFGLHAAFTVSDETLGKCAKALAGLEGETGIHIHVAEGTVDEENSKEKYGKTVVERLQSFNLLGQHTILGHCVFVSEKELDIIKETGSIVVHNPQSNMNNAVGIANVGGMLDKGILVGLGTDGVTYDMFAEAHASYFAHKLGRGDPRVMSAESFAMLLKNNPKVVNRFFGSSAQLGVLQPGSAADVIIVDYTPPTPLSSGNLPWHFQFGMNSWMVDTSVISGKVVMKGGRILTVDNDAMCTRAKALAPSVWERF